MRVSERVVGPIVLVSLKKKIKKNFKKKVGADILKRMNWKDRRYGQRMRHVKLSWWRWSITGINKIWLRVHLAKVERRTRSLKEKKSGTDWEARLLKVLFIWTLNHLKLWQAQECRVTTSHVLKSSKRSVDNNKEGLKAWTSKLGLGD